MVNSPSTTRRPLRRPYRCSLTEKHLYRWMELQQQSTLKSEKARYLVEESKLALPNPAQSATARVPPDLLPKSSPF
ncbi:hypothetical protein PC128_g22472 [Phytophthora cactorum]|nr:hypothetical protein PC128_g22472 [Phytophthora cactorum]